MLYIVDMDLKLLLLFIDQRLHHGYHTVNQLRQMNLLLRQRNLTALYFGHIQNFIDNT